MIRRRVVVSGHVQGVYFRATCADVAARHDVTGWVMNQPDGSVCAEFEGSHSAVEALIGWCHEGPPRAAVTSVEVEDLALAGDPQFRVL